MPRKPIPFDERPTWTRVKDLQEASFQLAFTVKNALSMREHRDKGQMQQAIEEQLRGAITVYEEATGRAIL